MKKPSGQSGEKDPAACKAPSSGQGRAMNQTHSSQYRQFTPFEIVPALTARRMEAIFRCFVRGALDKA